MKLIFENAAPLDPRAFTIMGLSVKESANPIGYFGTGLKYAIAVLLRTGHSITIQSESNLYTFGITDITFRDEPRQVINYSTNDGPPVDLGFTTDLGKNWEVWQAYRELASNCLDESGTIREVPDSFTPSATCITVKGDPIIQQGHLKHKEIFLDTTPLFTTPNGSIHPRVGDGIYYKGVKVGTTHKPAAFTYNLHRHITLTEDRTIKEDFQVGCRVGEVIGQLTDTSIINKVFHKEFSKAFEGSTYADNNLSDPVLDRLEELHRDHPGCLPTGYRARLECQRGKQSLLGDYTPTAIEQMRIATIKRMLSEFDIDYPPIKFASSKADNIFGFVTDDEIYLTKAGLSRGLSDLAITMLEEYHHFHNKMEDFSRQYQDFLLRIIVNLYAEKTNTCI